MIREKTACFTGHRPNKMVPKGISPMNLLPMIKSMLYYEIEQAIEDGYEYFITGMAVGVDLWAAHSVLALKNKHPEIKLICAVPFRGQGSELRGEELYDYNSFISCADEVIVLSEEYHPDCFKQRNYFMVENSSRLIAVVNNYRSGTGQTINYAKKNGLELRIIDAKTCCEAQKLAQHDKNSHISQP